MTRVSLNTGQENFCLILVFFVLFFLWVFFFQCRTPMHLKSAVLYTVYCEVFCLTWCKDWRSWLFFLCFQLFVSNLCETDVQSAANGLFNWIAFVCRVSFVYEDDKHCLSFCISFIKRWSGFECRICACAGAGVSL